jgi:hypothetical protein
LAHTVWHLKTMNTGGLVEIAKFSEGGMPVKSTHDENDINNYKRQMVM